MRARLLEDFLKKWDGSETWQGEDIFSESDALLRVMFDQSSLLMGLLKPDGTVLRINATALRLIKAGAADVNGKPFWETPWWAHAPQQKKLLKDAVSAAAKGLCIRFEATISTYDGTLMCIDFSLKPVPDDSGKVVFLFPEGRDLTERKLAEDSIGKSYALLRAMFDQSSLLMGLLLPDGTVHKINATAFGFISGREEEVIGRPFWETPWWSHSAEQQRQLREAVERAAKGEFVRFEAQIWTSTGTPIFIDFSLKPVVDDQGNVVLLLPEGRDVTSRKRAEEALREAAVKYRIVADNTYNWEFWLSPEGDFMYSSPSCKRISGYAPEEFARDPGFIWSIVHPEDRGLLCEHRHEIRRTREMAELELRIVRRDGKVRWIHHVCQPVFDDCGRHLGTRGSFSDITSRKLAEERNMRLAAIVESSDDAIVGKTAEGVITSWNRGAERLFGYREREVLGKCITELIPPGHVAEVRKIHERVMQGDHVEHFETVRRKKDGQEMYLSLTYSPIKNREGKVVAVSTIGRDITEQKRAARSMLEHARMTRELEIAKEIQQSFLPVCPARLPGLLMTCRCRPAAHVGGDYYDFFQHDEGVVDAVIADVTGHSVGSSLLMSMARSVLKAKVSPSRSPGALLAVVNDLLYDDLFRAELQISMFYVRLDTVRRTLAWANAGHARPLLYQANSRECLKLDAEGLLMGIRTEVGFEEKVVPVREGDILMLYTDGVTEAEDPTGEMFGTDRLGRVISAHSALHPQQIQEAIFRELDGFTQSDDVAMIIFKLG